MKTKQTYLEFAPLQSPPPVDGEGEGEGGGGDEGARYMKQEEITLKVNGINYRLSIETRRTLLEVLRENLGLTGTKKSCNEGNCGACTVLIDGRPVASCLVLAMDAQGKEILTIEGLSEGEKLHPDTGSLLKTWSDSMRILYPGNGDVRKGPSG